MGVSRTQPELPALPVNQSGGSDIEGHNNVGKNCRKRLVEITDIHAYRWRSSVCGNTWEPLRER